MFIIHRRRHNPTRHQVVDSSFMPRWVRWPYNAAYWFYRSLTEEAFGIGKGLASKAILSIGTAGAGILWFISGDSTHFVGMLLMSTGMAAARMTGPSKRTRVRSEKKWEKRTEGCDTFYHHFADE